ncbi:sensor histidine kinase [Paenibacillus sp. TRM 82003]|nr:sensor histidine kinase [Paenibacillus sp. TRM 82003]
MAKAKTPAWKRLLNALLLRDRTLMTKLLVFSAILVVVPMVFVGAISYRESSETLEGEAREYSWQIIEQVKHYVEDYLRDFEINTLKIVNHPDTAAFLRMTTLEEEDGLVVHNVRNVLKNSAYSRSDVTNITLVLDRVTVIDSADAANLATVRELEKEHWYDSVPATGLPMVYNRVIEWKGREEPVITIVKRIVNPSTLRPFGMLVIDVNYKRLQDVARKVQLGESGRGYLFILDEYGYYVYHPNVDKIGTMADSAVVERIRARDSGSFITNEGGAKQLLTFSRSDSLRWQLATSIPYDELMQSRGDMGRKIFISTAIFMAVAYVLAIGFAASLVGPIRRLHQHMRRVEIGDLSGKVPVHTSDEIGLLSMGFNKMTARLSQLLDEIYVSKLNETEMHLRQKETELKMLQAQINPHFLYNSLDTIRGMALEYDRDEIASMAGALARLLRYNVKEAGTTVAVRQELEIGEVYLRIQKFRFEEKLAYAFDVPAWAMEQQLPKLTLQPIVENAIVHGLEPSARPIRITVTAEREGPDAFVLTVADTGLGMTEERLRLVNDRLAGGVDVGSAGGGHIGIDNVHRRIRYVFGEAYGLTIRSKPGEGTEVAVRLPYREKQDL